MWEFNHKKIASDLDRTFWQFLESSIVRTKITINKTLCLQPLVLSGSQERVKIIRDMCIEVFSDAQRMGTVSNVSVRSQPFLERGPYAYLYSFEFEIIIPGNAMLNSLPAPRLNESTNEKHI